MKEEILVVDSSGNFLAPTYIKRANQLVRSKRANWVDSNTICIIKNEKETNKMEPNSNGPAPMENNFSGYEIPQQFNMPEYMIEDEQLYKKARKIVHQRIGFVTHFITYSAINFMLAIMSISQGELWFLYVACPWAIGLISHAISVFYTSNPAIINREFEKQKRFNQFK